MQAIIDLAESSSGLVTTAQVVDAGIPRARISDMVKAGKLERVQRGVYRMADAWEDEFLAAQLRFPRAFSRMELLSTFMATLTACRFSLR